MSMLSWYEKAWDDYCAWQSKDKKTLKRINMLLEDIQRNGHQGIGSPEPLKGDLSGCWSRRIDEKNRLVYTIENGTIFILKCGSHYGDK